MDVSKLSMALSQVSVKTSVSIALMKLAKDQVEQNSDQLAKMISSTGSIDIKI